VSLGTRPSACPLAAPARAQIRKVVVGLELAQ
jgi:hypothetical protein